MSAPRSGTKPTVGAAVVTGANSGVGLALCERLLTEYPKIKLCLVCRNKERGEAAQESLLISHPGASVSLVLADVGSIASVKAACVNLRNMYDHIDFLFLNAGVMANPKLRVGTLFATFFQPSKLVHRFSTGADLLQIDDGTTQEGYKSTFATNVLGHFCMVKELDSCLGGSQPSRIIWTSSSTASKEVFKVADIQHVSGKDPYASSKYLMDSVSVAMNEKLRKKNVSANTFCPGFMVSGLSLGILSWFTWSILLPVLKMLRLLVPSFTCDPYNGAEAMIWLTSQDPASLDPLDKYYSMISILGNRYTQRKKMDVNLEDADSSYRQLEEMINKMS